MESLEGVSGRWSDWGVAGWDGWTLTLMADNDLTYHHAVEVRFRGVSYVATPSTFSWARFRAPTAEEAEALRHVVPPDEPALIVAWDAETDFGEGTFFVVAETVEVVTGTVLHGPQPRRDGDPGGEEAPSP